MDNNILKDYYIKVNSINEVEVGDIVLISNNTSFFNRKEHSNLKKGIVVKKIGDKFFNRKKCIIYNINTLNYPNEESIKKITNYFNTNESKILENTFEFMNKFSKGEIVYLVKNQKKNTRNKKRNY